MASHRIVCKGCGRDVSGTEGPCPNCGSTARRHELTLESAVEVDDAIGLVFHQAATAVVGPSPPQPSTTGEDLGVLSLVVGGMGVGFEVGHAMGGLPGGLVGGWLAARSPWAPSAGHPPAMQPSALSVR